MTRPGISELGAWLADQGYFTLAGWHEPVTGYPPASSYAETFWLPVLGPTSLWVMRRLVARPRGERVDLEELAGEMGLGNAVAAASPVVRSVTRLAMFDLLRVRDNAVAIRPMLGHLSYRQELRLPPHLQRLHVLLPTPAQARARAASAR